MSEKAIHITIALLIAGLLISYGFFVRQAIREGLARARREGSRRMRSEAAGLARYYASVATPTYETLYNNLADRLGELPLE